jgi:hypothetical protein
MLLIVPASQLAAQLTWNRQKFSQPARSFDFTYNFTLKDIPSRGTKRVRVWMPAPKLTRRRGRAFGQGSGQNADEARA